MFLGGRLSLGRKRPDGHLAGAQPVSSCAAVAAKVFGSYRISSAPDSGYRLAMARREALQKEIDALDLIIRSDKVGLKLNTLSSSDLALLEEQIKTRSDRLKDLRQQLDALSS